VNKSLSFAASARLSAAAVMSALMIGTTLASATPASAADLYALYSWDAVFNCGQGFVTFVPPKIVADYAQDEVIPLLLFINPTTGAVQSTQYSNTWLFNADIQPAPTPTGTYAIGGSYPEIAANHWYLDAYQRVSAPSYFDYISTSRIYYLNFALPRGTKIVMAYTMYNFTTRQYTTFLARLMGNNKGVPCTVS
jgi:hypothetical protein